MVDKIKIWVLSRCLNSWGSLWGRPFDNFESKIIATLLTHHFPTTIVFQFLDKINIWGLSRCLNAGASMLLPRFFQADVPVSYAPCRHGTMYEPILNQYYLFKAEPILKESWTMTEQWLNQSYWFIQPLFGHGSYWFLQPSFSYGSHTYIRIRSHFASAEPILNKKCLQGHVFRSVLLSLLIYHVHVRRFWFVKKTMQHVYTSCAELIPSQILL